MADVIPFRGIIYNIQKIGDLSLVTSPPYDVISEKAKQRYYEKHPYNVIRLELGDENLSKDRYYSSLFYLEEWLRNGILIRENEPAFYFYQIDFPLNGMKWKRRRGFIGLCKLEEFGKGMIFPHERIHQAQKEDRLNILRICQANFSQIFSLYSDPNQIINSLFEDYTHNPPLFDYYNDEEKIHHKLWSIKDRELFLKVRKMMEPKALLIADGHHRYEAALAYKKEMEKKFPLSTGNEPFYYTMMYFCPIEDEGLVILPSHRLIFNLSTFNPNEFEIELQKYFIKRDIHFSHENELAKLEEFFEILKRDDSKGNVFGLYINGNSHFSLLYLKNELNISSLVGNCLPSVLQKLDVMILHRFVIEQLLGIKEKDQDQNHIRIIKNHNRAFELVKKGNFQMVFFLNPPKVEEIKEVASEGEIMPQKSTFFYPKIPTGLVINKFFLNETINEF
jgi:uncharacterized protein (DUF1015 family)